MQKLRFKNVYAIYASIFLLTICWTWSFLWHRPMLSEGSDWYLSVLNWRNVITETMVYRYVDYLIQGPAVFVLKVFGNSYYELSNSVAIYILSFDWTMHMLASLLVSAFILRRNGREDLLTFQVIAVLATYMQASGYAVALAMPAMSCFWPIFYFLLFARGFKKSEFVLFFFMAVLLMFCYEATVLFFGLFSFLALLDIFFLKKKNLKFNIFVIVCSVLASSFLSWIIIRVADSVTNGFWNALFSQFDFYRQFGLCIAALLLPLPFISKLKVSKQSVAIFVFAIGFYFVGRRFGPMIYATYLAEKNYTPFGLYQAWAARSTALPMTALVAGMCVLFKLISNGKEWLSSYAGRTYLIFLVLFSFAISSVDIFLTNQWRAAFYTRLANKVSVSSGCVNFEKDEFVKNEWYPHIEPYSLPTASIMTQVLQHKYPVTTVFFTNYPLGGREISERNACLEVEDRVYKSNQGFDINTRDGYVKFAIGSAQ